MTVEAHKDLSGLRGTKNVRLPDSPYTAEIHMAGNYINNFGDLLKVATSLKADVFQMSEEKAEGLMEHHMGIEGSPMTLLEIPSIILFQHDEFPYYVGYSTQRVHRIDTTQGPINLLAITRTIIEDHQSHKLGRFAVEQGPVIHNESTHIGFRGRSPAGVRAALLSGVFQEGEVSPWLKKYTEDPRLVLHQGMMGLWYRIHKEGAIPPNTDTGVSRNDYIEDNVAYKYRPDRTNIGLSTAQILDMMKRQFRMKSYDSVYTVGELK